MLPKLWILLLLLPFSACTTNSVEPLQVIHHENFPISPFKVVPDRFVPYSEYHQLEKRVDQNKLVATNDVDHVQKNVEKKMQQRVDLIKASRDSVLLIVIASTNADLTGVSCNFTGTGFLIDGDGLVVTANHVTESAGTNTIVSGLPPDIAAFLAPNILNNSMPAPRFWQILKKHQLTFLKNDLPHDLALYQSQELKNVHHLKLADNSQKIEDGEDAIVLGYPFGELVLTHTKAMIAAHIELPIDTPVGRTTFTKQYKIDASVNSGNSGGPLLSLRTGKVIGVVDSKVGKWSENLTAFKNNPSGTMILGNLDVVGTMREMVDQLQQQIYFGLGYAISSEYVSELLGHKQVAQVK